MIKSTTRIVTCVYHSTRDSEMGGRGWPEEYYKFTLWNIFNLEIPVTIYCYPKDETIAKIQAIIDTCKENINKNIDVEIKHHVIQDHPLYHQITSQRNNILAELNKDTITYPHGVLWTRNEVICHSKLPLLKKTFEEHPEMEHGIWIDAGITHWGLTPKTKGGMEVNGYHKYPDFYPFAETNVFNPKLGDGFVKLLTNHDIVNIGHKNNWYDGNIQWMHADYLFDRPELKELYAPGKEWKKNSEGRVCEVFGPHLNPITVFKKQVVGGIVGINRSKIDHILGFYNDLLQYTLNHPKKVMFTEEPILSLYHNLYNPHLVEFCEWYHNIPGNPCRTEVDHIEKSFFTIWDDITNYELL